MFLKQCLKIKITSGITTINKIYVGGKANGEEGCASVDERDGQG